jgi:hypothetical protein
MLPWRRISWEMWLLSRAPIGRFPRQPWSESRGLGAPSEPEEKGKKKKPEKKKTPSLLIPRDVGIPKFLVQCLCYLLLGIRYTRPLILKWLRSGVDMWKFWRSSATWTHCVGRNSARGALDRPNAFLILAKRSDRGSEYVVMEVVTEAHVCGG